MRKRTRWIIGGAMAAVVVAGAGTGIAVAAGEDDDGSEVPITGSALERATTVALEDLKFSPSHIQVPVGASVKWRFADAILRRYL